MSFQSSRASCQQPILLVDCVAVSPASFLSRCSIEAIAGTKISVLARQFSKRSTIPIAIVCCPDGSGARLLAWRKNFHGTVLTQKFWMPLLAGVCGWSIVAWRSVCGEFYVTDVNDL